MIDSLWLLISDSTNGGYFLTFVAKNWCHLLLKVNQMQAWDFFWWETTWESQKPSTYARQLWSHSWHTVDHRNLMSGKTSFGPIIAADWRGWNAAMLTHLFLSSYWDKLAYGKPVSQITGLLQIKMSNWCYLCDCAQHRTGGGWQGDVVRWKNVFHMQSAYVIDCLLLWTSAQSSQCSNVHVLLQCLQLICPGSTWPWSNSGFCWDNIPERTSPHQDSVCKHLRDFGQVSHWHVFAPSMCAGTSKIPSVLAWQLTWRGGLSLAAFDDCGGIFLEHFLQWKSHLLLPEMCGPDLVINLI